MRGAVASRALLAAACLLCCHRASAQAPMPSPILSNPSLAASREYWPTRVWRVARPSEKGMDETLLAQLEERISGDAVLAMLVVKGGYIVAEHYKEGYDSNSRFSINSCTKSLTSALLGIALDRGWIASIDAPVAEFYPLVGRAVDPARKLRITLRHLLSMSSSIDWPEWSSWNFYFEPMTRSPNWIEFVLARPMLAEPGAGFNYNTGGSQVLAGIVQQRAGMSLESLARAELFSKIGVGPVSWPTDPQGINYGGYGVRMSARDAAKLGFLYLNNGLWAGERILSSWWIDESTRQQSAGHPWFGKYGLHWWLAPASSERPLSMFFAMGYAGQYIFVVPSIDLVVVFASSMPGEESFKPMRYLEQYIVKSIR